MRFVRNQAISNQNAAVNQVSLAYDADQMLSISVQAVSTGSAVGSVKLQASNDSGMQAPGAPDAPTNWSDIPSTSTAISGPGAVLIPKTDVCYRWVRVVYTFTSGAGTISCNVMAFSV